MTSSLIKKLITYHNEAKAAIVTKTHEVEVALFANTPSAEMAIITEAEVALVINNHDI
jgi:hypothetical protein